MHRIETCGSWREMGRQLGEAFAGDLRRAQELFAPWLVTEADKFAPALSRLRQRLAAEAPDLLAEALGMAEGAGLSAEVGLGYRLFNQVAFFLHPGCSVVFLRDTDQGPLLGRNCDLGPYEVEADLQLCHVRRPVGQAATIEMTYLGLAGGGCLNEQGLGMAGASAPATVQGEGGLPGPVVAHRVMQGCRTVQQAREVLAELCFLGKPANYIIADASGDSALYEFVPGLPAREVNQPGEGRWRACTNFMVSEHDVPPTNAALVRNAYARYGRIMQVVGREEGTPSRDTLQGLLADIAQPGPVCPEEPNLLTAYSHLMDLTTRTMHLWPGHPAQVAPLTITL
jgi:hypothetical protein